MDLNIVIYPTDPLSLLQTDEAFEKIRSHFKQRSYNVAVVNGKPRIRLSYNKHNLLTVTPEEVTAMYLESLKEMVMAHLKGTVIKNVVISVPAFYNDPQRQAIKAAAKIANLNVMRIINDPTAAAISDYYNKTLKGNEKKLIVIDIGGTSTKISVIKTSSGVFNVLGTTSSFELCGQAFDFLLMEHLKKQILISKNLIFTEHSTYLLLRVSEKIKKILSARLRTDVDVQISGYKYHAIILRSTFESICMDLVASIKNMLDQFLDELGLIKKDIDEVILSGGCTFIPEVKLTIEKYFGFSVNACKNPTEIVAFGAGNYLKILLNMNVY